VVTASPLKLFLLSVNVSLALEKSLSAPAEVAGTADTLLANTASNGYDCFLSRHQCNGKLRYSLSIS